MPLAGLEPAIPASEYQQTPRFIQRGHRDRPQNVHELEINLTRTESQDTF
jgi:hypothetical protein